MKAGVWIVATLAGLALLWPSRLPAAEPICAADVHKLCGDVPVGGGRIQACLKQHEAQVSEACRNKLDKLGAEVKLLAAVCRWDIARLCSDVDPGAGRVLQCLQTNQAQLSPECLQQLRGTEK
jgi:hypothetical protein